MCKDTKISLFNQINIYVFIQAKQKTYVHHVLREAAQREGISKMSTCPVLLSTYVYKKAVREIVV